MAETKVTINGETDAGGAWLSYTPTITASIGTFTTVSATGRYIQIGKTVIGKMDISITTNGTAAGNVVATLPVTAQTSNGAVGYGRADGVSGKMVQCKFGSTTTLGAWNYDNTYPGANGEVLRINFTYEAA